MPSHFITEAAVTTWVCSAISACGTLNVDAGSVRRAHSSPPNTVSGPSNGATTTHSPGPSAGAARVERASARTGISIGLRRALPRAQRQAVIVFAVEVDQRDERAPLVSANRAGLRQRRYLPPGRQDDRVAQAVQRAVEDQIVAQCLVARIAERSGELEVGALPVVDDRHLE